MTTRSRESPARQALSGDAQAFPNLFAELGRHQLALVTEGTSALYRGSEDLRKIQQEAAHEASAFHRETAQKLCAPCQPSELMAIQSKLIRFTLESAHKYWQQMAARMMQTQVEMVASVTHVLESEKDMGMKSPLEVLQAAMPPMAQGLFPMTAHVPDGQPLHS